MTIRGLWRVGPCLLNFKVANMSCIKTISVLVRKKRLGNNFNILMLMAFLVLKVMHKGLDNKHMKGFFKCGEINRPGVAGAVLQTPSSLID